MAFHVPMRSCATCHIGYHLHRKVLYGIRKQETAKIQRGDYCSISFPFIGKIVILTCIQAVIQILDQGSDEKIIATP